VRKVRGTGQTDAVKRRAGAGRRWEVVELFAVGKFRENLDHDLSVVVRVVYDFIACVCTNS